MSNHHVILDTNTYKALQEELKALRQRVAELEQQAAESEQVRFRWLVESVKDYEIILLDPDGYVLSWNPGAERLKGYKAQEIIGKHFSCFYRIEDISDGRPEQTLKNATDLGRAETEGWRVRKDGSQFWANVVTTVLRDDTGQLKGFAKMTRDITERKQTEAALQQALQQTEELFKQTERSEHLLRTVIDATPDWIFAKDPNFRMILANKSFADAIGRTPEEMLGKDDLQLGFPLEQIFGNPTKGIRGFRTDDQRVLDSGEPIYNHFDPATTADDSLKIFDTQKLPLRDTQGNIFAVLAFSRDITERQQAEEALRKSEAKFQKMAANVPGMIYQFLLATDGLMSFPFVSSGCRDIYELEPEEIQNNAQQIIGLIHSEDRQSFDESVAVSAQTLQPWKWEGRFITPSGKLKWIQGASRPEMQADGSILWDGLLTDITDRKQAEEVLNQKTQQLELAIKEIQQTQAQLVQSEKMSSLGQLVAGVAHEINNPINFIHGNVNHANEYIKDLLNLLQLYQHYYPQPVTEIQAEVEAIDLDFLIEDLPKLLASMKVGAERIRQIVLSLRNFSRLDEAEQKPVDIHEGIDNTLLILQHRLKEKSGRSSVKIIKKYGDLPLVECYAGQLNQVFMNILTNGIDALEEYNDQRSLEEIKGNPSLITIYTEVINPDWVQIRIVDNGLGMTEEVRQRLFDPFFTTKSVGKGTGLGLSISYQIVVEKHKGKLQCISAPGQGAEFLIKIPIRQRY